MNGEELKMNIGKNIRKYREAKRYSLESASQKLGCNRQQFFQWENGIALPRSQTLCDIADTLGVNVFSLLCKFEE